MDERTKECARQGSSRLRKERWKDCQEKKSFFSEKEVSQHEWFQSVLIIQSLFRSLFNLSLHQCYFWRRVEDKNLQKKNVVVGVEERLSV